MERGIMKTINFLSITVLFYCFISCSIIDSEENIEPIDSDIIFSVTYDSTGIIQNHTGYLLLLKTEKIYSCSNFQLKSVVSINGDKIVVDLIGVEIGEICATALGPATARIPLELYTENIYFNIVYNSTKDRYSLQVNNKNIAVREIESNFTSYHKFNFDF